jgi:hypothetical protein
MPKQAPVRISWLLFWVWPAVSAAGDAHSPAAAKPDGAPGVPPSVVASLAGPGPVLAHERTILFASRGCLLQYSPAAGRTEKVACPEQGEHAETAALAAQGQTAWMLVRPNPPWHKDPSYLDGMPGILFEVGLKSRSVRRLASSDQRPTFLAVTKGAFWLGDQKGIVRVDRRNPAAQKRTLTTRVSGGLGGLAAVSDKKIALSADRDGIMLLGEDGAQEGLVPSGDFQNFAARPGVLFATAGTSLLCRFGLSGEEPIEIYGGVNAGYEFKALAARTHGLYGAGEILCPGRLGGCPGREGAVVRFAEGEKNPRVLARGLPVPAGMAVTDDAVYVSGPADEDAGATGSLYRIPLPPR